MLTRVSLAIAGWVSERWLVLAGAPHRERGQDLVEYAVLIGGIGVALAAALIAWGPGSGMLDWFVYKVGGCISLQDWSCGE